MDSGGSSKGWEHVNQSWLGYDFSRLLLVASVALLLHTGAMHNFPGRYSVASGTASSTSGLNASAVWPDSLMQPMTANHF